MGSSASTTETFVEPSSENYGDDSRRGLAEMPCLDAWIRGNSDRDYFSEILWEQQERPINIRPGVACDDPARLLALKWKNSGSQQWASFLGRGLIGAAGEGDSAAVQQLLAAGATLNARDGERCTALHRASCSGHINIVKLLLSEQQKQTAQFVSRAGQAGALNMPNLSGYLPLHLASASGNSSIIRLLLESDADATTSDYSDDKETPLHHAVIGDDAESIALLVDAGGDVMAKDAPGWTPLHKAAIVGKKNAVHALIEAGAAIEARASISGRTPLHEACAYLQSDLVSQLLLLGADEDAVDADSQTPDDVVGRSVLARNVQADDTIRLMLKGAPAARRWRRRSLLILLRSRQFPTDYEEGESAKDGGIVLPLSPQLTHPVTIAREGNASQQHGEDLRFLTSGALALPEGVFRTVVLFL